MLGKVLRGDSRQVLIWEAGAQRTREASLRCVIEVASSVIEAGHFMQVKQPTGRPKFEDAQIMISTLRGSVRYPDVISTKVKSTKASHSFNNLRKIKKSSRVLSK